MTKHPLHKRIGEWFVNKYKNDSDVLTIKDSDCGGKQRIPLFIGGNVDKSRATNMCNVDLLIIRNNKIAIVVEIEESNIKPTQICGKFLTTALFDYFSHKEQGKKPFYFSDLVCFIQILDDSKLDEHKTKKDIQGEYIINTISKKILNIGTKGRVRFIYKLIYCNINTYKEALENNTMYI